jgi:iron(III) transport system permease protein
MQSNSWTGRIIANANAVRLAPSSSVTGSSAYSVVIAVIAAIAAAPIFAAVSSLFQDTGDTWTHLAQYVLPEALLNTLWLAIGVALVAGTIGVALAWIIAAYEFPGRRFFRWALLLPMAMPGYVLAFAFAAMFEFTGPVQGLWRELLGDAFGFPNIGARAASILTLSLVLYPYVFLIVREAFASQGIRGLEVAQSCGLKPLQGFFKVSLPMARPFIVGGVSLAVMECLADFGTVQLYNYTTFTTAIYRAWYGLFSLESAQQLSLILISLVLLALLVERRVRGAARFTTSGRAAPRSRLRLKGRSAILATSICVFVFSIAFLLPTSLIAAWSISTYVEELDSRYWQFAANTLMLAVMAAMLVTATAVLMAYAVRRKPGPLNDFLARVATLGYAVPGTVLAVGFFVPIAAFSRFINQMMGTSGADTIALQSGLAVILFAYLSRFLAVAHSPVNGGLSRISPSIEDASRGMGVSGLQMLFKVHLPILRPAILTGALLVFVDVMKELPITLMTRPFGWDTLAVRVFQLTTEGEWHRAALPALGIVAVGLIPVVLLTRQRNNA